MSKSLRAFRIPFAGLKLGTHSYEFDIDKTFFDELEYSLISDGKVHATLQLEKKETMMIGHYAITGTVSTVCDRCNDPLEVPVTGNYRIIYKFGTEVSDDENLIVLPDETYELDVVPQLYELISVSLPTRLLHPPGECNEEMLALLGQHIVNANEPDDDEDWDEDEDDDWDEDDDREADEDDTDDDPDGDKPIDPRWSALKNLN